jgi:hypothetical protein
VAARSSVAKCANHARDQARRFAELSDESIGTWESSLTPR